MKRLFPTLLIAGWISAVGYAQNDGRFTLAAKVVRSEQHPKKLYLVVELNNVSGQPQKVAMIKGLFEGHVYLRNANHELLGFIHQDKLQRMMTTLRIPTTDELAAGASLRFTHPLTSFICDSLEDTNQSGSRKGLTLDAAFQPGCELWCSLVVHEWKLVADGKRTPMETAFLVCPIGNLGNGSALVPNLLTIKVDMPQMEKEGITAADLFRWIELRSKERDPSHKGVKIKLDGTVPNQRKLTDEELMKPDPFSRNELPSLGVPLRGVPLIQAIKFVALSCACGFRIEDDRVVIVATDSKGQTAQQPSSTKEPDAGR